MRDFITTAARLTEALSPNTGHNAPPEVRLVKTGKAPLGGKTYDTYDVLVGDRKVGSANGRYTSPKAGQAGGHSFNMTLKGQDFYGSKARLIAWVEKMTCDDI